MPLRKVRLELARTPDFPEGSARHGYELVAPLDDHGHLDPETWRKERGACRVHRFWAGEDDLHGRLIHRGNRWAFHYEDSEDPDDEEPIYKLDRHVLTEGEYLSITEHDGLQRTFLIISVAPLD
jgi:hypothetical protein